MSTFSNLFAIVMTGVLTSIIAIYPSWCHDKRVCVIVNLARTVSVAGFSLVCLCVLPIYIAEAMNDHDEDNNVEAITAIFAMVSGIPVYGGCALELIRWGVQPVKTVDVLYDSVYDRNEEYDSFFTMYWQTVKVIYCHGYLVKTWIQYSSLFREAVCINLRSFFSGVVSDQVPADEHHRCLLSAAANGQAATDQAANDQAANNQAANDQAANNPAANDQAPSNPAPRGPTAWDRLIVRASKCAILLVPNFAGLIFLCIHLLCIVIEGLLVTPGAFVFSFFFVAEIVVKRRSLTTVPPCLHASVKNLLTCHICRETEGSISREDEMNHLYACKKASTMKEINLGSIF